VSGRITDPTGLAWSAVGNINPRARLVNPGDVALPTFAPGFNLRAADPV
jgi:hypothetical protein